MTEYYKPLQAAIANLHHALKTLGSDTIPIVELDSITYWRLHDSMTLPFSQVAPAREGEFMYHGVLIRDGRR